MFKHPRNIIGVAVASLVLVAASAGAQGKGHDKGDKGKDRDKSKIERIDNDDRDHDRDHDRNRGQVRGRDNDRIRDHDRIRDNDRIRDDDRIRDNDRDRGRNDDVFVNGRRVPPGLAKKPGGMPPGQYKKRYGTTQGVSVLSEILGQRGYTVVRTVPAGESRYVYYRASDGSVRRAIVSPGREQLTFTNVPADLLREVLARLR